MLRELQTAMINSGQRPAGSLNYDYSSKELDPHVYVV